MASLENVDHLPHVLVKHGLHVHEFNTGGGGGVKGHAFIKSPVYVAYHTFQSL